ncbi:protein SET [Tribolium castaneum]|uniref:Protein SET-like Protein n=1 Tax=Tribolium castaneum TaxID=7070 RepID=D6X1D4_TRICA|nr:PREDICTED: protein SET [Tribolium castaneum]EFA10615.1 Protein SET-like Protein [Tribolium castaneum]|eukprot:XP_001812933.1 PREDICTED: protein SET [Tribolium castaneum]
MSDKPAAKKAKTGDEANNLDDSNAEAEMDSAIIELESCHNDLDKLNEKENEEVIALDQKYRKLRQECYDRRSKIIEKISDFWFTVFTGHPDLCNILTEEEEDCLHYLRKLEVDMADNNSGYSIKFYFKENPYFENDLLVKEISYKQDKMASESTKIKWLKPQKKPAGKTPGKKRTKDEPKSFFGWFSSNDDPANDKIAEIIKDDVWANTLQYYLPDPDMEGEDDSNESSEGEDEGEETNGDKTAQASGDGTSSN